MVLTLKPDSDTNLNILAPNANCLKYARCYAYKGIALTGQFLLTFVNLITYYVALFWCQKAIYGNIRLSNNGLDILIAKYEQYLIMIEQI